MSSLTIDLISSLDGFAAADDWPGYWGKEGPDYFAFLEENLAEDHVLIMGATTYREMAQIVTEIEDPTIERMAGLDKIVFSSTLQPPLTWSNTRVVAEDAATALRRMKGEQTIPLRTMGSISLTRTLLLEGLVDLLRIVVFPVVTGQTGHHPIYAGWPDLDLDLVTSRTLDGRLQVLEYVPTLH